MEIQPLHTKVEKSIQTLFGVVVLESMAGFPKNESNLYCASGDGKVIWKAEKPDPYTLYSRVRPTKTAQRSRPTLSAATPANWT